MIAAMVKETFLTSPLYNTQPVETIYFGGGTPSLLTIQEIKKLLKAVYENYNVESNAEITLEANPDDINEITLQEWKAAGINRFSVGIQSFADADLQWMNRAHDAAQALKCIELIKNAGFTNFSIDLIYGTPGLTDEQWLKNIDIAIACEAPHIACYALTVEPNTALDKMISLKKKESIDTDKQAAQFLMLMELTDQNNYEHYEISNFAKKGFRSKHNSSYWRGKSYAGIGPSAHSYNNYIRRWNISNNALYMESINKNIAPFEEEILTINERINEMIMISLRTMEGLDLKKFSENFGEEKTQYIEMNSQKHFNNNDLIKEKNFLKLTHKGKLFADGIAADLFF